MSFSWTDRIEDVPEGPWRDVLSRSRRPSPFLSPCFLLPWARAFARERQKCVGTWETGGRVDGLIFLCARGNAPGWELLGGEDVADALDAVVASGLEPEFWSAFLASLSDLPAGGPVVLPNLVEGSPALAALPLLCPRAGLSFRAEEMDRAPYVPLPPSFDGYLEALGGKERHELRRKMRRAESLVPGLAYRVGDKATDLASDVASFIDLHRRSSPAKDAFMTGGMAQFFGEVAERFFAAGQLRLAFLGGQTGDIASVFQIEYDGALLLYNSGFDPAMRAANPGLVLVARCIEDAIGRGLGEYDFLRGTERYKYDLGGRDRVVYRGTIGRP